MSARSSCPGNSAKKIAPGRCTRAEIAALVLATASALCLLSGVRPALAAAGPPWMTDSNQISAQLGHCVAAAGDVNGDGYSDVLAGAPLYDNGQRDEGRALLFLGSAAGIVSAPAWTAESDQRDAQFANSIASAGDVNGDGYDDVIVGCSLCDDPQADEGRVFLYLGSPAGLSPTAAWTYGSNQTGAHLGSSVASAGDVNGDGYDDVIVGASEFDNGQTNEGAAFVFLGSPAGLGPFPAWTGEPNLAFSAFGFAVSSAGDVNGDGYSDVIVGANQFSEGLLNEEGAVFAYLGSASGLSISPDFVSKSSQANARMGVAVGAAGDVNGDGYGDVIVGANFYDNGEFDEGAAFVFAGTPSGLAGGAAWTFDADKPSSNFGISVGFAGDLNGDGYGDIIVGASTYTNGQTDEGMVFIYLGSSSGPVASPAWSRESDQSAARYGAASAGAGDVNGDGFSDFIVGAYRFDAGESDEGRLFVYGSAGDPPTLTETWSANGALQYARLGWVVGSAGDVNADGFADIIVTADGLGYAYVAHGSPTGPGGFQWGYQSPMPGGWSVSAAAAGDVNGDGFADLIVGEPRFPVNGSWGRVSVFHGSAAGLGPTPALTILPERPLLSEFGFAVASAGDVNGDGFGDIVFSEIYGQIVRVHLGSVAGLSAMPDWEVQGAPGTEFGLSVASAGDVNGDGFGDLIVGANRYSNGEEIEGAAYLYLGSASGLIPEPAWIGEPNTPYERFGWRVASAGDVNGDGYGDVIIGAPEMNAGPGYSDDGKAYLFLGSSAGLPAQADWIAAASSANEEFGFSVASAGDANGDGYGDVIIGAAWYGGVSGTRGRAVVYLGSPSGLPAAPAWEVIGGVPDTVGWCVDSAGDTNGDGFDDVIVGAPFSWGPASKVESGMARLYYGNSTAGMTRLPRQFRADDSLQIPPMGRTGSFDSFHVHETAWSPEGRATLRLAIEVKPRSAPFDGQGVYRTAWQNTGAPLPGGCFIDYNEAIGGLSADGEYKWRSRVESTNRLTPSSPWFHGPGRGLVLADFRTEPSCAQAPPGFVSLRTALVPGAGARLRWDPLPGATAYDIVRGPISTLFQTGGDFSAAVTNCLGDDRVTLVLDDAAIPSPGDGFWYLLRGVSCGGKGTYDSGASSQIGWRDAELDATPASCP